MSFPEVLGSGKQWAPAMLCQPDITVQRHLYLSASPKAFENMSVSVFRNSQTVV